MDETFDIAETKHGIEISVRPLETADKFDDFLVEDRDIEGYLRNIENGMIFGLGERHTRCEALEIIEAFRQSRSADAVARP